MKQQTEKILEVVVPIATAVIGLYALYYVKVSIPQQGVALMTQGVTTVAETTWGKVKEYSSYYFTTAPGFWMSSTLVAFVLSNIGSHSTDPVAQSRFSTASMITMLLSLGAATATIYNNYFAPPQIEGISTRAAGSEVSIPLIVLPANFHDLFAKLGNIHDAMVYVFLYIFKDKKVVIQNENVVYGYDTNNMSPFRLIRYNTGNIFATCIQFFNDEIKDYITCFDTSPGGLENARHIMYEINNQHNLLITNSVEKRINEVQQFEQSGAKRDIIIVGY